MEPIGRQRPDIKGELNPGAKLSDLDVKEIRARADAGESYVSIGDSFGISAMQVSRIHRGKKWKIKKR